MAARGDLIRSGSMSDVRHFGPGRSVFGVDVGRPTCLFSRGARLVVAMSGWLEEVMDGSASGDLTRLPDAAFTLFRMRDGVFELAERHGYSDPESRYTFLEEPESWSRALSHGAAALEPDQALNPGLRPWVLCRPIEKPEYLLVIEIPYHEEDAGPLLRYLLARHVAELREGMPAISSLFAGPEPVESLPVWLAEMLPELIGRPSPLLVMAEPGSGREELTPALIRGKFGEDESGIFFHPGRMSAAVQLRELFGDSGGKRLGGEGPGIPIVERPEKIVVIQEAGGLAPIVQLRLLDLLSSNSAREKFWIFETSRQLGAMVEAGVFQAGLHSLLKENVVVLPPVRACLDSVPLEVERLLDEFRNRHRREISLTNDALEAILKYDWPGNWVELKKVLESAFLMSRNGLIEEINPRVGGWSGAEEGDDLNLRRRSEELEKSLLLRTFALHSGNQVQMARTLGISRGSLQYKLEKYQLQ